MNFFDRRNVCRPKTTHTFRTDGHGSEFRIIACECCGGDRGHFDDLNQRWITCRACNGEGEIEIEPEPISLDDL